MTLGDFLEYINWDGKTCLLWVTSFPRKGGSVICKRGESESVMHVLNHCSVCLTGCNVTVRFKFLLLLTSPQERTLTWNHEPNKPLSLKFFCWGYFAILTRTRLRQTPIEKPSFLFFFTVAVTGSLSCIIFFKRLMWLMVLEDGKSRSCVWLHWARIFSSEIFFKMPKKSRRQEYLSSWQQIDRQKCSEEENRRSSLALEAACFHTS